MDQADPLELGRHRRQLATDGLLGERFAAEHGAEHEWPTFFDNGFSVDGNECLNWLSRALSTESPWRSNEESHIQKRG